MGSQIFFKDAEPRQTIEYFASQMGKERLMGEL